MRIQATMRVGIFFLFFILPVQSYKVLTPLTNLTDLFPIEVINDVINELFLRPNISFEVVTFGRELDWHKELLLNIKQAIPYVPMTFRRIMNVRKEKLILKQSAILIGIGKQLDFFNQNASLQNEYPKDLRFLIFLPQNYKYLGKIESLSYKDMSVEFFEYFLYFSKDFINVTTFEWYTENSCNRIKNVWINSFNSTSRKWQKPFGLIERKFKNFHSCQISVSQDFLTYIDNYGKVQGAAFDILDAVGSKANFTVYRQFSERNDTIILFMEYKNLYLWPQILVTIDFYNSNKNHMTTSFDQMRCTMIITKGEKYGSYEKLLMPFDITTWCLLAFTFIVAFSVIFVVNRTSKRIQKLLYGESTHFPAFNVLGTFFGISQVHLPASNFPRMILMCFILFCLVIRNAYQGVFFELMAADIRKHVPTTIDGLIDKNYTFLTWEKNHCFTVFNEMVIEE